MLRLAILCLLVWPCILAADETSSVELIPRGRPFKLPLADPTEIRTGVWYGGDSHIFAAIGNYFSLLGLRSPDGTAKLHWGLEGQGVFGMRQANGRFPLETTDGYIGTYFEGTWEKLQGQLRYTHLSSHLADGSAGVPIAFSREYLTAKIGFEPMPGMFFYGGGEYIVNAVPRVPALGLQIGTNLIWEKAWVGAFPFLAVDLKFKQESEYNPTFVLKLGFSLMHPEEAYHSFRLFYSYLTGADPRGQFYNKESTSHSLGIEMAI